MAGQWMPTGCTRPWTEPRNGSPGWPGQTIPGAPGWRGSSRLHAAADKPGLDCACRASRSGRCPAMTPRPSTALGFAGIAGQLLQKSLHQRRQRGVELCGPQPGTAMDRLIHRNCDVLHGFTVGRSLGGGQAPAIAWPRPQRLGPAAALSSKSCERSATRSRDRRRIP